MTTKTIDVKYLARVEGEGALTIKIKDKKINSLALKIFEPPRFFESFLRGRDYSEAPDITSRICGICPVAYQMSAVSAVEQAFGFKVPDYIETLRKLLYFGEWIESHVLHIYMLHAPDFLKYPDAITMAKDFPDVVKKGLRLKKAGNSIVSFLGGREIHPINVKIGGFYSLPDKAKAKLLLEELRAVRDIAEETIDWVASFDFIDFEAKDYEFVALSHPDEYAIYKGRIISSKGIDIESSQFEDVFEEIHMEHSNALHCIVKDRGAYMTGPMARYQLNRDKLNTTVLSKINKMNFPKNCINPFKSIIIRAFEVYHACIEAIAILETYDDTLKPAVEFNVKASTGYGCTEAPRGILYHKYAIDDKGKISEAQIIPPTSQNQRRIEQDLKEYVEAYISKPEDELTYVCEQAIRNYDPCISCATHFLNMKVEHI